MFSGKTQQLTDANHSPFWASVMMLRGSVTLQILPRIAVFGLWSVGWLYLHPLYPWVALDVGPVEIGGGALGMLLVLRLNAGYERWWEGRRLWGAIVNNARNLVVAGLAYGPRDAAWQAQLVAWSAAFAHCCRHSLRREPVGPEMVELLGAAALPKLQVAAHKPLYATQKIAELIDVPRRAGTLDKAAFWAVENVRAQLVDQIGGCERINASPLPSVMVIKVRRFIALYLALLPLALVDKVGWATPVLVMLISYATLGIDEIAQDLQSPFDPKRLGALPLDDLCRKITDDTRDALGRALAPRDAPAA